MKILCWREKIEEILDGKIPTPVSVEIDPSNLCTQDCVWCMFKKFRRKHPDSLDPKIMFSLIEELARMDVRAITFTGGGEPLVNPATPRAMLTAKSLGIQVGLVTNGDLLDKDEVRDAVLETCRYVRVSLDAGSDETYYKLKHPRFRNQFTRNLESIQSLIKCGFKGDVGAAFLIHPDNYSELPELIEKLEGLGVSYLQVRPCIGAKFTLGIINYSRDVVENYKGKLRIFANFKRFDEIKYGMIFSKCVATPLLGVVGADAKMYLCCQYRGVPRFAIGDLSRASFGEQWGKRRHRRVIENIDISRCPPCRYSRFNQIIEEVFLRDKMHKNFV